MLVSGICSGSNWYCNMGNCNVGAQQRCASCADAMYSSQKLHSDAERKLLQIIPGGNTASDFEGSEDDTGVGSESEYDGYDASVSVTSGTYSSGTSFTPDSIDNNSVTTGSVAATFDVPTAATGK